jgi:hypothetical protein
MDSTGSGYGLVAGSSKHSNEPAGSVTGWEFLDQLSDYQLLEKYYD